MAKNLWLLLLGVWGCEPKIVDAVREPPPLPSASSEPVPTPLSPLETSLIHRYSFDGDDTEVRDSKFSANGRVLGTKLPGTGQLPLAGERSDEYVDLPNGIVSGLGDATFEVWLTWDGGDPWQRIFDFGNSSAGQDSPGTTGTSYLFLTTVSSPDLERMLPTSSIRLAYSQNGVDDEDVCNGPSPLPSGVETHVAVVVDRAAQSMALYQDGARLVDCVLDRPLSAIDDVNNWLGRSNYVADPDLSGTYDEFRIYGAALTPSELSESFAAGPDAGH
jgi:hypothetical protein